MNPDKSVILDAALQLTDEERAELAETLFQSVYLKEQDPQIETAWSNEIKSRLDDIDSGKVKMIPGDQVMAEMRKRLDDRAK